MFEQVRIEKMLKEIGFSQIKVTSTLKQAREFLLQEKPSLVIADIALQEGSSLELLNCIRHYSIPTIFLAMPNDESVYKNIELDSPPHGYLVKPINKLTFFSTIRLLCYKQSVATQAANYLLIRANKGIKKVLTDDILWLEVSGNYTIVVTAKERLAMKKSLVYLQTEVGEDFVRVHKQYCVNIKQITHIRSNTVVVHNQEIPVSYARKKVLLSELKEQAMHLEN